MPLGASRINGISKVIVVAAATIVRRKIGISAIGNAQVDTAQSKFGGASALFDGTGDYLLIPNATALATNPWTIEYWVRFNSVASFPIMFDTRTDNSDLTGYSDYINASGKLVVFMNAADRITSTTTFTTGVWYHIAVVRDSSNNIKLYVNGTNEGSTYSHSSDMTSIRNLVGTNSNQANFLNGWMDEVRVSKSARYTTNFTAPTAAFVNDDDTLLLLHMNGTDASTFFEDDNGIRDSRDLRAIGNAQIDTAQSKFGGSSYLGDGTGDYLISNANSAYDFGTGSFTIEFWVRFASVGTLQVPTALREGAGIENGNWWCEVTAAEKKMYWGFKNQAGTQYYVNLALAGTAFVANTWYHIALVNNAGTARMYIDGTATGVTTTLSGSFGTNGTQLWIGAGAGGYSLNGHIDEYRISNTARYTANFTPSTTPFTNDDNTRILVHFDGTDASTVFRDDNGDGRSPKGIFASGNVQIDTAQSKFGGASALFDGSGDYLTVSAGGFNVGTGNITVECWVRHNAINDQQVYWDLRNAGNSHLIFYIRSDNKLELYDGLTAYTSTATLASGTWYHLAVSRSGSSLKVYIDGVEAISATNSRNLADNGVIIIGTDYTLSTGNTMNGWIDELRISNSARYTTGFTPSTTPFQNDANTLLLLHMDGTDAATVFIDDNGDTQA